MSKIQFTGAAVLMATAMASTTHSASIDYDCHKGELTLARLAGTECLARIPLPTARPDTTEASEAAVKHVLQEWEFIETTGGAPGETRTVRLIGSRFLPGQSEKIDFQAHASSQAGLLNAAFHHAVAYLGLTTPKSRSMAEDGEKASGIVREARADFGSLGLRN